VENAEGELVEVSAPTVEEIDGNQGLAPEGELPDLGQAMDDYAKTWFSMVYVPGQSVYDGWYKSQNGVGLYEGDDIEHRVEDE